MPVSPMMPAIQCFPESEHDRVTSTTRRYALATESADELAAQHMEYHLDPVRRARMGPPDTAQNPLVQIGLAVSTPGHYGRAPMITGDTDGRMEAATATLWPRAQWREFLAYCLGACAQHVATVDGEPVYHIVPPCDLWAIPHPDDGTRPVVMRWLRVREIDGAEVYAWDEWDVRDPAAPTFRIVLAETGGRFGDDVTARIAPALAGTYPWIDAGAPYIPWAIDRSRDVGDLWNWRVGRGAALGTLTTMMLSTGTVRTALNSTGKIVLLMNGEIATGATVSPTYGQQGATLAANPGDIIPVRSIDPTIQPSAVEIGEVDTLEAMAAYTVGYAQQVVMSMGIAPTDATRTSAPQSGWAISLNNQAKREEQRRRNPLCRACDLATIRHVGALLGIPTDPIGIVYAEIQPAPAELADERAADEWEIAQGIASRVDVMMRRRPGLTREQAIAELRRVRAEERAIEAEEGPLPAPAAPAPTPTPPEPPDDDDMSDDDPTQEAPDEQ